MLEFFRAIPPPVLVPVLMLAVGIGDAMKIAVIISGCVWPILLNTIEGVRAIDEVLTDTCRTLPHHGLGRIRYLVLPRGDPQIMAGVRQALSIALILMVISEMFAAPRGLGYTIVQFQRSLRDPGDVERHRAARPDRRAAVAASSGWSSAACCAGTTACGRSNAPDH